MVLGGPALYLVGNALFKRTLWGYVPGSRLAGIAVLGAAAPLALVAPSLVLLAVAVAVLAGIAVWDVRTRHAAPAG